MTGDDFNRLKGAHKNLLRVMATLETGTELCGHCDRPKYKNWDEHNIHQALEGATNRIAKAIRWVKGEFYGKQKAGN
jgi:hypothetical protein